MGKLKEANKKMGGKTSNKTKAKAPTSKISQITDSKLAEDIKKNFHQIWLAGLGAFSKIEEEGSKLFDNLVQVGEDVESKTGDKLKKQVDSVSSTVDDVKNKASETWDKMEQVFDDRVSRALNRLGIPTSKDIEDLSNRVTKLTKDIKSLQGTGTGAKRTTRARTTKSTSTPA